MSVKIKESAQGSASYSTQGFRDRDDEAALDAIAAAGFIQVELLVAPQSPGPALNDFCARLRARGLRARTVHTRRSIFPQGWHVLGGLEEEGRKEGLATFAKYIRFAAALGAGGLIVHPVPDAPSSSGPDDPALPDRLRASILRSLDDLVPVAQDVGVRILLENINVNCSHPGHYLLKTMGGLRPLVDAYPEAYVGLVLDTGHAWTIGRDPVAEIHAAGSRLWGTHLQDVNLDNPTDSHWMPTHGGLDWGAIRRALDEISYAGVWTFEVANPRYGESLEELARLTRQLAIAWGLSV